MGIDLPHKFSWCCYVLENYILQAVLIEIDLQYTNNYKYMRQTNEMKRDFYIQILYPDNIQ